MRTVILVESLLLLYFALSYFLKCKEYKDLRVLFDNRGNSIQMLNRNIEKLKNRFNTAIKINAQLDEENDSLLRKNNALRANSDYFRELAYSRGVRENDLEELNIVLKHKVFLLRKDIKRKDKAIVRYKAQNKVFKHGYNESEKRNEDLRDKLLTEQNVASWYKNWYAIKNNESEAFLFCLRQIQKEVEDAKKE